ncbi:dTDP-4-dehydrorhamnose reductase [Ottowia sp.]|uniref:dTDP-4-dehydrorhamnose reductase n=1 Tax=Ottowia sp. TaxID=1898956 RepID=UPI0025F347CD|nr:dTDP-4-dehydrorhamnose reductase [Ottowia sp.]MBK6616591.1 dTDP-4-dehydrorhamnose reductase [Ottowia sp.]
MKVLLLGKDGQLGVQLQRSLGTVGWVVALGRESNGATMHADLCKLGALREVLREVRPDLVVNAAAFTAVDRCESEQQLAQAVNAVAPGVVAEEVRKCGGVMVHFSTDYVFDGAGDRPFDEECKTSPLNVYGMTKLEGEERVRSSGCRHLILRTSWLHSPAGNNFVRTVLSVAAQQRVLRVVNDQIGAPTPAGLLADVTAALALRAMRDSSMLGTYHCAAKGETSWFEYATRVVGVAREAGLKVLPAKDAVVPIATGEYASCARRPLNCRLSTRKLESVLGTEFERWEPSVDRTAAHVVAELLNSGEEPR